MCYNSTMISNYFNRAIQPLQESLYRAERLERIKGESDVAYFKRRESYLNRLKQQKQQRSVGGETK